MTLKGERNCHEFCGKLRHLANLFLYLFYYTLFKLRF